MVALFVKIPTM